MSRTPLQFLVIVAVLTLWMTRQSLDNGIPIVGTAEMGWWVQTLMRMIHSLLAFDSDVTVLHIIKSLNPHVTAKVLHLHGVQRASTTTRHTCANNRD